MTACSRWVLADAAGAVQIERIVEARLFGGGFGGGESVAVFGADHEIFKGVLVHAAARAARLDRLRGRFGGPNRSGGRNRPRFRLDDRFVAGFERVVEVAAVDLFERLDDQVVVLVGDDAAEKIVGNAELEHPPFQ